MGDPLDDVRRALGIPPVGHTPPQEVGAPPPVTDRFTAATQLHEARARLHEQERERLAAAGDDADGLDELRRAFRRAGR